jgi:hypothetical protein
MTIFDTKALFLGRAFSVRKGRTQEWSAQILPSA